MEILHPPSDDRYTITFGPDKTNAVSFTEAFLKEHFDYFNGCLSNATVECAEKKTNLADTTANAFAIIVAFLVVGVFPKLPHGGDPSQMITDRLNAAILADYLGVKSMANLVLMLQNDVREILTAYREALTMEHIETALAENVPESFVQFVEIFAAAAIKPTLLGWMKDAKRETIEASIAGQSLPDGGVYRFKRIIEHYESLLTHDEYGAEVFKELRKVIQMSKRLNKLAIDTAAVNKNLKQVPGAVDHVTYRDPLPIPTTEGCLFTV
ncbi:hypothetical protein B0T11DRAFT_63634 [Plectosphaerella cucumerina]|uniref:Uncharacterized protein n=1 Tax=Plectosphaerella cucumerina TaxID=40658 RepID=A0A8K0X792_9PEZI|nr:hypothetical protein B0T11DRAFT_63634 [Plectosphaerella cucumerina]